MRCEDVTRELNVPTGALGAAELARHVASCPECRAEAHAVREFDQLWDQTRPACPAPATWDRLWGRVEAAAERPDILPMHAASPGRRWGRTLVGLALVAQAAAVLVAVGLWVHGQQALRSSGQAPPAESLAQAPMQAIEFELEEGQTLFLELDESGDRIVCRPRFVSTADLVAYDEADAADPYAVAYQTDLLVLNVMEGME